MPKVVKTIRTRSKRDLSFGLCLILTIGVACWVVYPILKGGHWVFLGNAVILCLTGTILLYKIPYWRPRLTNGTSLEISKFVFFCDEDETNTRR